MRIALFPQIVLLAFALLLGGCTTTKYQSVSPQCTFPKVPVAGFTEAFVGNQPLVNAKITVLETGKSLYTDKDGLFSFCAMPGEKITLEITKESKHFWDNYQTTQTGTFIVPSRGLTGRNNEVTFQVPRKVTYASLESIVKRQHNLKLDPTRCNVATTVTAYSKTLADDPQGEPGAKILLWHGKQFIKNPEVIYFGVIFDKTNPFKTTTDFTSLDGGAVIYNLKPSKTLYYLSAEKPGLRFSTESFLCRPGAFINLSPPHAPSVVRN